MGKKYVIFIELWMKGGTFTCLKVNNSGKSYNFKNPSMKCANDLLQQKTHEFCLFTSYTSFEVYNLHII